MFTPVHLHIGLGADVSYDVSHVHESLTTAVIKHCVHCAVTNVNAVQTAGNERPQLPSSIIRLNQSHLNRFQLQLCTHSNTNHQHRSQIDFN